MEYIRKQKTNKLSNKEKVVFAYHCVQNEEIDKAIKLLTSVDQNYYIVEFHKDISRALLCHATCKNTDSIELYRESEFYLVVYRLVKFITESKVLFSKSGYFSELRDTLFKGFPL